MRQADDHLRAYEALLIQLHRLNATGGDAAASADVCEAMEANESHFDQSDIDFLNGLSGDLYMLVDREVFDPGLVPDVTPAELPGRLSRALSNGHWEELLALLRVAPAPIRLDQVAYMRSRAYEGLGHLVPAITFMDEAARRRPAAVNYPAVSLQLLYANGAHAEAVHRATAYLDDPDVPPRVAIMAAGVICRGMASTPFSTALAPTIRRAIGRLPDDLAGETLPSVLFVGYATLGMFERQLGNGHAAAEVLSRALAIDDIAPGQSLTYALAARERDLLRQGRLGSSEEESVAGSLMNAVPMGWAA